MSKEHIVFATSTALLTIVTFTALYFESERLDKIREVKNNEAVKIWHTRYPDATSNEYRFCDKNNFLVKVRLYDTYIGDEYLVTADNDVPIRCNPTSHHVQENVGYAVDNSIF